MQNILTRDRAIFLVSLGLALLLWIPQKLTQEYNHNFTVHVSVNTSTDRQIVSSPVQSFPLEIRGRGNALFRMDSDIKRDTYFLDQKGKFLTQEFSGDDVINKIRSQDGIDDRIAMQSPVQRLIFSLDSVLTKTVNVVPNIDMTYAPNFGIVDTMHISPIEIEIKGPHHLIKDIKEVETEVLKLTDVKQDVIRDLRIQVPDSLLLQMSHSTVEFIQRVDQMIEKEIVLELMDENDTHSRQLFPNHIRVRYAVPLALYDETDADQIEFELVDQGNQAMSINILNHPDFAKYINHTPKIVRFFMQQSDIEN